VKRIGHEKYIGWRLVTLHVGGFCAAKTGFDGLSSMVLVRFHQNFLGAWIVFLQEKFRTFGWAMQENLVLKAL
jgi:hypothetical protein